MKTPTIAIFLGIRPYKLKMWQINGKALKKGNLFYLPPSTIILIMFNGKVGHKGPITTYRKGNTIQNNSNVRTVMNDSELGVEIA